MKIMCIYMDRQSNRLQKRKLLPEYLDIFGVLPIAYYYMLFPYRDLRNLMPNEEYFEKYYGK